MLHRVRQKHFCPLDPSLHVATSSTDALSADIFLIKDASGFIRVAAGFKASPACVFAQS